MRSGQRSTGLILIPSKYMGAGLTPRSPIFLTLIKVMHSLHYVLEYRQLASLRDALVTLKFKLKNELEYATRFQNPEARSIQSDLDQIQKLLDDTKVGKLETIVK